MDVRCVSYYFASTEADFAGAAFFAVVFLAEVFLGALAPFAGFVDTPSSRNTILIVLRILPERPRPNGRARRMTAPLLTVMVFTKRLSTEAPFELALAIAESKSLPSAGEDFLGKYKSAARACAMLLPRMRSATRRTLRGDW